MTLHFHDGAQNFFIEILSTFACYSGSGINTYSFQNLKTELKILSSFRRYSSKITSLFLFTIFRNLWWRHV